MPISSLFQFFSQAVLLDIYLIQYAHAALLIRPFSVSADTSLRLWDTQTHAAVAVLTGHTSPITSVHFSPSSSLIAAASCDACIRLWSTSSGTPVVTLTTHTRAAICSVAWSIDEALVAAGACDGSVCVWESATGLQHSSLQCPQTAPVAAITIAPATDLIAVAVGPGPSQPARTCLPWRRHRCWRRLR